MRIAMIGQKGVPATYGGIERHVEEVGARLVEKGHEVRVYTRPYYADGTGLYRGMACVSRPTIHTKHLDTPTHTFFSTMDVLMHPVDIVHYHALGPSALSWLPRMRGIPTVVTLHGLDWEREKWGPLATYLLRHCEYPAVHCPNRTVAVSRTLQRYFETKYLIRTDYIPNGVNDAVIRPASQLAKWNLDSKGYFLFVGRLTPEKGAHLLTEAFGKVSTNRKLVIAGGSSFTEEYVQELQGSAPKNTVFTGYVHGEELEALWSHAYAVVLPSTLEGLSIALLEALSYGRCVLVSDIPENLEVVDDAAPRFRSRDVGDLAAALTRLDGDPGEVGRYEGLVENGLRARYRWDAVVARLEALYRDVLTGVEAERTQAPPEA